MREHDEANEEDEVTNRAYDDDRERFDSYLAAEPPAKRARGGSNNDDDEDDARLLSRDGALLARARGPSVSQALACAWASAGSAYRI